MATPATAGARDDTTVVNDPFFFGKYPGFGAPGFDAKGFLGGLHAGANWQDGRIVGGLEIDLSLTDIRGSSFGASAPFVNGPTISNGTATNSGRFDLLGSARARLGYLVWPEFLIYGTGGLAWTRYVPTTDLNDPRVFLPPFAGSDGHFASTSIPTWRFGWVAGIGGEVRLFGSNWLARLEYLHYDFGNSGSFSFPDPNNPLIVSRSSGDLTVDVVRVGLSYKLDRDPFAPDAAVFAGPPVRGLITKAPARVAVPWTWSGYYIGAHAGYGWGRGNEPFDSRLLPAGVPVSGVDSKGFVVGFQAGANWQSGPLVGGLEIDLAGAGIKGSGSTAMVAVPGFVTTLSQATRTDKFDRLGSARARLGYLVSPGMLLYGTAGLGWTRFVNSLDGVTAASAVTPHWLFGWVAGVGLEKRLGETNWLARVEYLHYDFGDSGSFSQTGGGVAISTTSGRLTNDVVRTALSYKLDWPEFIAARHSSMLVKGSVAAPWSWSGFYVGGHAGYGWGRDPFEELAAAFQPANFPAVILHGLNSRGFVGGFQAGANWQDRSVVGGLEIDLSWSGIKGSTSTAGISNIGDPVAMTHTDKLDLLGSARARLGYLAWPSVLFYATGGLAWTRLEQTVDRAFPGLTIQTTTPSWRFGWVAGAGAQARLWKTNWLARVEYLHYDFGNSGNLVEGFTTNGALDSLVNARTSGHLTADVVRLGLDYKLD